MFEHDAMRTGTPTGESDATETDAEFNRLLAQMNAPDWTRENMMRLDELLRNSASLRKQYLEHCQLEAILWENAEQNTISQIIASPAKPCSQNLLPQNQLLRTVFPKRGLAFSLHVVFLVAITAILLTAFVYQNGQKASPYLPTPALVQQTSLSVVPQEDSDQKVDHVAKITRDINAKLTCLPTERLHSSVSEDIPAGLCMAHYELTTGLLEIEYLSGARIVFHAPAKFTLLSDSSLQLHRGRINVIVPTMEAQGFVVSTPSAKVIDLGTEFAVEVGGASNPVDEFHVFSGEIQIYPDLGDEERISITLKEGQAFLLDHLTTTPVNIDIDKYKFIRTLHSSNHRYQDLILEMRPHFYVTMDPSVDSDHIIADKVNPCNMMQVKTALPDRLHWSHGIDGGLALSMDGSKSQTFAIIDDYPRTSGNSLTVSAWVLAETRPYWGSIAKHWSYPKNEGSFGQFHLGLFKHTGRLEAHIFDNDDKECFVFDSVPLPLHQWHHVVMVVDETVLTLYRNGVKLDSTAINGLQSNPVGRAMAIGAKPGREPGTYAPWRDGLWDGRIDHVAIFDYALLPDQIETLFEEGEKMIGK